MELEPIIILITELVIFGGKLVVFLIPAVPFKIGGKGTGDDAFAELLLVPF